MLYKLRPFVGVEYTQTVGLYRIYFFPIQPEPDLEWYIWLKPEPDFQIDCIFTNLMCKTLRKYEWFEFLIIFLCSSYHYDFLNFWISYLFRPTRLSYYSSKLSNVWGKSTFQIRQNYLAPVGFLPEPDFCRIWKKCRILTGAEIWYSPNRQARWLTMVV